MGTGVWETDLQFQHPFYPHCSAKEPDSLSFCNFSPPVFVVFELSLSKMFSELAVTCVCSLQSVVPLDKNDLNLIFFQMSEKGWLVLGIYGKLKKLARAIILIKDHAVVCHNMG